MANATIDAIVRQVAKALNVDPNLAVATEHVESQGNPTAVGDQGTSFGLFQLHKGGELGNLTPQQAFDPVTNATRALTQIKNVQLAYPNIRDPGQIAAMAQRPADPTEYAKKVDQEYLKVAMRQTGGFNPFSGLSNIPGSVAAAPGDIANIPSNIGKSLPGVSSVEGLVQFLTSGHNWLRLGEILAGATLMIIGVVAVGFTLGDKDIAKAAGSVATSLTPGVGELKSAKRLSKTGKAPIE